MSEPRALSVEQRNILRHELDREDLSIFTCVRMARRDLDFGHFDSAMARLASESDKLRTYSKPLDELIKYSRGGESPQTSRTNSKP